MSQKCRLTCEKVEGGKVRVGKAAGEQSRERRRDESSGGKNGGDDVPRGRVVAQEENALLRQHRVVDEHHLCPARSVRDGRQLRP